MSNLIKDGTIEFKNIEILNNENGSPFVKLHDNRFNVDISISLSHDKDKAIAFAVVIPN